MVREPRCARETMARPGMQHVVAAEGCVGGGVGFLQDLHTELLCVNMRLSGHLRAAC